LCGEEFAISQAMRYTNNISISNERKTIMPTALKQEIGGQVKDSYIYNPPIYFENICNNTQPSFELRKLLEESLEAEERGEVFPAREVFDRILYRLDF
jgi:hypothetical protein